MTTGAHLSEPGGDRDPSRPNVGPFEPPQSEPVIPPQSEPPAVPPVPEPPAFPPVPPWRPPEPRYQKEASGAGLRGFGACDSGGGDCRCPGVCGRRFGWVWIRS